MEPQWRRLRYEFGDRVRCRVRMGGLLADWQSFHDPITAVSRPGQMGPHWFAAARASGMPIDERVWMEDPPASSYPACLAVKAAELQGGTAGARYLRLREAVMLERRNIARRAVLLDLAAELGADGTLDTARFAQDLDAPVALEALRDDLNEAQYHGIGRFPTLVMRPAQGRGVMLVGYRPYSALRDARRHVAPALRPVRSPGEATAAEYASHWGRLTARELAESRDMDADAAGHDLEESVVSGALERVAVSRADGALYRVPPDPPHGVRVPGRWSGDDDVGGCTAPLSRTGRFR